MRYLVPALDAHTWHTHHIEIEKSQFIAWVAHTPSTDRFHTLLEAARHEHPNASHHCSAFIAGAPGVMLAWLMLRRSAVGSG